MKLLIAYPGTISGLENVRGSADSIRNIHNPNSIFDEIHLVEAPSKNRGVDHVGEDITVYHTYTPIGTGILGNLLKALATFVVALKAAWIVRRHDIDVIRGQGPFQGGLVGVLAQWLTGVPAITSLHNDYDKRQRVEGKYDVLNSKYLTEFIERLTMQKAAYTFVLTSYLREYAIWHGVDEEDIYVLPNHIDPDSFRSSIEEVPREDIDEIDVGEDEFMLVFVGRLAGQKDPDTLLNGYKEAKEANPSLSLVIVGDGPLREEVRSFVERNDLSDVTFTGFVDRGTVAQIMYAGDAFVFPTRCEGLGYVFKEAHATDLPVVTTDIPHTKAAVNEDNALLFEPGDAEGLADRIDDIRDDSLREKLTARSKDALERLSSDRQHDKAEAAFREIIGENQ